MPTGQIPINTDNLLYANLTISKDILKKFISKLVFLMFIDFSNPDNYFQQKFYSFEIKAFSYNSRNYQRMVFESKEKFYPYFSESEIACLMNEYGNVSNPINYIFITLTLMLDYTYKDDSIRYGSSNYIIIILDENGEIQNLSDLNCTVSINFPMIDNLKLNSSSIFQNYQSLNIYGINIFDKNDNFFKDFCFKFSGNSSNTNMTLSNRAKNFFLNLSLICMGKSYNNQNNSACKFNTLGRSYIECNCNLSSFDNFYSFNFINDK